MAGRQEKLFFHPLLLSALGTCELTNKRQPANRRSKTQSSVWASRDDNPQGSEWEVHRERMEEKDCFSRSVYGDSSWCPLPVSSGKSHSFFLVLGKHLHKGSFMPCFTQTRRVQRKSLPAPVDSELPSAQRNPSAKVTYFGVAFLDPSAGKWICIA